MLDGANMTEIRWEQVYSMLKAVEDAGGSVANCKSVPTARGVPQHHVPFVPLFLVVCVNSIIRGSDKMTVSI